MPAIPRYLALSLAVFLALVPPASAMTISDTSLQPGDTLSFSGSMHVLDCTNGDAGLRVLLKEPAGGHADIHPWVQKRETLHGSGKYTYRSISFGFQGSLQINGSWPPGEYELVADGHYHCYYFYDRPVTWIGDKTEGVKFTVSGMPAGWEERSGRHVKEFHLDRVTQTSLVVSAHQSADCWVNGRLAASKVSSRKRVDITPYLEPGNNTVSCRVNAGYERVCEVDNGDECGCECNTKFTNCLASGQNWNCPPNVIQTNDRIYVPVVPSFDAVVAQHRPSDILWSSDGSEWRYSRLPVTDSSMFLDRPEYYSAGTIYQGPAPWSSGRAHFSKWVPSDSAEGTLAVSALLEPSCTLNGRQVRFDLVEDDWWVFQKNVSLSGLNHIECMVGKNNHFNLFDVAILEPSGRDVPAASPFAYSSGKSGKASGRISLVPLVRGAGQAASSQAGAAVLAAVSALGVASVLTRRRKMPGGFLERVETLKQRHLKQEREREEFNRKWGAHLREARRNWRSSNTGSRATKGTLNYTISLLAGRVAMPAQDISVPDRQFRTISLAGHAAVNQGTLTMEEMVWAERYGGVRGIYQMAVDYNDYAWESSVFIGEEEMNTTEGWAGAHMSYAGYVSKDAGTTATAAGAGMMASGLVAGALDPPVGGAMVTAGAYTVKAGAATFSTGVLSKTSGDALQGRACIRTGNRDCFEEARSRNTANTIEAGTALFSVLAAPRIASGIMKGGKSVLERAMSKNIQREISRQIGLRGKKLIRFGVEKGVGEAVDWAGDEAARMFREDNE